VTTSQITIYKSNIPDRSRINVGVLAYMRERNRGHIYNCVIGEFEKSGISQAMLAARLGKAPEVISRWLGSPSNWTQDTVSDLLFAISGGEPTYGVTYPLSQQSPREEQKGTLLEAVPYYSGNNMIFTVSIELSPPMQRSIPVQHYPLTEPILQGLG
jgi:hypothetical protein